MKFTKLLVLGALLLVGKSAWAVDANVWTQPTIPEGVALTAGETYYFYNIGAGQFLYEGNNYSTQANVSDLGLKIKVELDEASNDYTLTDSVIAGNNKGKWLYIWFVAPETNGRMYVDYGNQGNYLWQITDKGNNIYRLSPSASNADVKDNTKFVGIDRSVYENSDTLLAFLTDDPKYFIDWKLIPVEAGNAFFAYKEQYAAAMKLKEVLDEAEAKGIAVPEQLAIYNNTASTTQELLDAIAPTKEAIALGSYEGATGTNPADVTTLFIKNPNFDNGSFADWKGSAANMKGDGNHLAATVAEFYNATFDSYQDISDLREGIYSLSLQAGHRGSYDDFTKGTNANAVPYLYLVSGSDSVKANFINLWSAMNTESFVTKYGGTTSFGTPNAEGETTVGSTKYFIPNNPSTFRLYAENGYYLTSLFFETTGGNARIGVKKTYKATTTDWAMFDSFKLTYYGKGADAYQAWSDEKLGSMGAPEGAFYTESYKTALDAATTGKTAANKADVEANIAAAEAALEALNTNIKLWNDYKDLINSGKETYKNLENKVNNKAVKADLDDYLNDAPLDGYTAESTEIINAKALDNAGLETEIAKLKQLITNFEVDANSNIKAGDDVTNFMVNPAFDDTYRNATGWTQEPAGVATCQGSEKDGKHINQGIECYNKASFDVYQILTNKPVGIYEISVQGFYRYGRDDAAYQDYNAQEIEYVKKKTDDFAGGAPVYVYINEKKTPFKNVYEEPYLDKDEYAPICAQKDEDGNPKPTDNGSYQWNAIWSGSVQNVLADSPTEWYPNDMISGAVAFSKGMYTQSAYSLLAKAGEELRIGVKGSSNQKNDSWVIWDNFKLTFRGTDINYVKPTLVEAIADANNVLIDPETQELKPIGKDAYEKLQAAIADAEGALDLTDGDAMFEKLVALVTVDVDASVEKFNQLYAAYEKLSTAYNAAAMDPSATRPSEESINAALNLMTQIDNGIQERTLTDADADALMEQVEQAIAALKVPAGLNDASDDNPLDLTKYIVNPKYEEDSTDGWTRENATGNYSSQNNICENYNGKFDVYQDLTDLPEGTYEVGVQLFYRNGGAVNDYKTFNEDPTANNNMSLYVKIGEDVAKAAAPRLAKIATEYTSTELDDNKNFKPTTDYAWALEQTELTVEADSSAATGMQVPNMRSTMRTFFDLEIANDTKIMYASIIFKVGADGKARIGVEKSVEVSTDWSGWTNWTLNYFGKNSQKEPGIVDGIKDAAAIGDVVKTEYFNVNGARVNSGKGIVIIRQTLSNGTVRTIKKIK